MATVRAMFTITDTGDLSGRNLLQRSFFTKYPWTGPTYNAVGEGFGTYHERKCLPVTARDLYNNTNNGVDTIFPDLTFEEGVQYTISGNWAQFRTDDKFNKMFLRIRHTDGTTVIITQPQQNNIWSSFTLTSTPGKTVDKITVSYSNAGITYIENFKLEVGASATDWTPAPEDVNDAYLDAKTAKNEIDGLEIGGRNILKHSEQAGIITRYGNSVINTESGITVDEWMTNSGVRYYGNAGTSTIFGLIGGVESIAQKNPKYLDRSYAFSVYVKNLSETSRLRFRVNGTSINAAVEITPLEQKRVTYVYSNPSTASNVQLTLYVDAAGDAFDFVMWHPQIEYGTRVTDWTPAPEDVEEAIESKNSVYYQATAPTAHKVGDTWFDTAHDYKISRWDGTTWVAAELGDQAVGNLDASHINTGTLTAVDIEAGKAQDIAGTIKVYDEDDDIKVSLDKDGLVATKGTIGGWEIDETSLSLSVPYQYNSSGEQVIAHGDDTDLIQLEDPQLVGASGDDNANISLLTFGRDQSDGIPYILCDDGTLDGSQVRVKNGKISCLKNDNTLTNGISAYIQSDAVVLSESSVVNNITRVRNVRLKSDKVEVLYIPDYENATSENIQRAQLTRYNLTFSGDSTNPALATGIAHWTIFAQRRTIKDELGVTIYHCGNLFWAHFDGKMTVGWRSRMEEYISIYPNDDASFTNSQLCAPPSMLEKYCLPQSPANPRAIYRVFPNGQIGLYHFIPPTNGDNNYEVLTYDNWEPCDIFWAHIG